jgi:hypothetical protein
MHSISNKLLEAVRELSDKGPIKRRLASAFDKYLITIPEADVPNCIDKNFAQLRDAMHVAQPLPKETWADASIRKMSETQAGEHARTIVNMHADLMSQSPAKAKPKPVSARRDKSTSRKSENHPPIH